MSSPYPAQISNTADDFTALRRRVAAAGCFDRAPLRSVTSLVAHVIGAAALSVASARGPLWATAPLFLAASFLFYRIGWLMHDAAHGGVFVSAAGNHRFAALCAGVLGAFPSGWRYGHNRHHAAPNVRGRDLDQSERWDPSRRYGDSLSAFVGLLLFSKFRGVYLPKTLLLLGLRDGYFCFRHARSSFVRELVCSLGSLALQATFFAVLFGWKGPLAFLVHTIIGLLYLNTAFAGNHYDLESFDEAEAVRIDFAELQIRTTRNYPPGPLAGFVFGGLEYQIEHHLFPNMPRRGFARAAVEVRAFCAARGLRYEVKPFDECIRGVLRFHVDPPRLVPEAEPR